VLDPRRGPWRLPVLHLQEAARGAMLRALAGLLAFVPAQGLLLRQEAANATAEQEQGRTVVFWHVGNSDQVVQDQLRQLLETPFAGAVRFVADRCPPAGRPSPAVLQQLRSTPGFEEVPRHETFSCGQEYFEMPTLWALHEHCQAHPEDFVAYIHTKSKDRLRQGMMKRLLQNRKCIDNCLATGKVACGVNVHGAADGPCPGMFTRDGASQATWCHFSGNFWWARCDYVATLNPPWEDQLLDEAKLNSRWKGWWGDARPYGRYFAEWWLLNDVQAQHRPGNDSFIMGYSKGTISSPHGQTSVLRQAHLVRAFQCPAYGQHWESDHRASSRLTASSTHALERQHKGAQDMYWKGLCPASLGYANLKDRVCGV